MIVLIIYTYIYPAVEMTSSYIIERCGRGLCTKSLTAVEKGKRNRDSDS
jgi:hypothetical protein